MDVCISIEPIDENRTLLIPWYCGPRISIEYQNVGIFTFT